MNDFFLIPIVAQSLFILIDEFYFHMKRGLPLWERIGHPLDTFSFILCFLWTLCVGPTPAHINIFLGLSFFTCMFVTKDEFIHKKLCEGGEQWIHSILFILHPASLIAAYQFWLTGEYRFVILIQTVLMGLFMLYQFFYWHFFGRHVDAKSK